MEKNNKKEIDFVLRYYSEGKIDTQRAISLFKVRTGRTCRRSTWGISAVAATVITLIIAGAFMLFHQKQTVLTAENAVQTFILPDSTKVTLSPHSSLQYSENDCRTVVRRVKFTSRCTMIRRNPLGLQAIWDRWKCSEPSSKSPKP